MSKKSSIVFFSSKLIIFFLLLSSCTETKIKDYSSLFPNSTASNYFKRSETVTVEVYYETGAEPFDDQIPVSLNPWWEITEDNIDSLLSQRSIIPTLTVPKTIDEMTLLNITSQNTWSAEQVLSLYQNNHQAEPTTTNAVFYIYFLKGNSSSSQNTIAFSINTTPIIAVFKDVIRNSAPGMPVVQRFVEQSTIVHELGHAFGLVNNGIPLTSNHQDTQNGSHTVNSSCVMYYLNEGAQDLVEFIDNSMPGDYVLWGSEVLADAHAFSD